MRDIIKMLFSVPVLSIAFQIASCWMDVVSSDA